MPRLSLVLAISALAAGSVQALAADAPAPPQQTLAQSLDAGVRDAQLKRLAHDYAGAVRVLSQLMLAAPDDPRVVSEYGKVLVQQGRMQEAIDFLARAVQLRSNDWTLYSALGVAYDQTGDFAKARTAYEQALALKPGESVVLNNYAMSRMLAGDLAQAKKLIAQAAAGSQDERIARNVKLIDGLAPAVAAATPAKAAPVPRAVAAVPNATVAEHPPRPLVQATAQANAQTNTPATAQPPARTVVMQAVPADPKAGPVTHPKRPARVAVKPKPKAQPVARNQIPALRLANDRP